MAAVLSQKKVVGMDNLKPISVSNPEIQTITQVVDAIARYTVSAEDLEMVFCFLVFQDNKESPNLTQKPVRERRVIGQDAQSESQ